MERCRLDGQSSPSFVKLCSDESIPKLTLIFVEPKALFLTSTDVDKTNKSYYGETNLYLVALRGGFDCRVNLDKEGPVHDFHWAPNSREFGVVYGCKHTVL
jgi:uncharacterized protein with WD repeat